MFCFSTLASPSYLLYAMLLSLILIEKGLQLSPEISEINLSSLCVNVIMVNCSSLPARLAREQIGCIVVDCCGDG